MQYIINFIDWITNTITSLWDLLVGLIENLILLVEYIGIAAELAFNIIGTLPDWLQAFGFITITVSILYMILGRNTGGTKE